MTNRIAFSIVSVDRDALVGAERILDERNDVAVLHLRRPYVPPVVTTIGTVLTGVSALRHEVYTLLVPVETEVDSQASRLRLRTSRMSGAPFAWNRLASRNIRSLVVNFPFQPANDDDQVIEIMSGQVKRMAEEKGTTTSLSALGFIAGTMPKQPDIRCIFTAAHFGLEPEHDPSAPDEEDEVGGAGIDPETDLDENDATDSTEQEKQEGRKVVEYLDGLGQVSGAEHTLAILAGSRLGYIVLIGPRASEVVKGHARGVTCVPTLLDLLGEAPAADLPGMSLVSSPGSNSERKSGSWSLDGGPCEPPDWGGFIQQAAERGLTDPDRSIACRHLFSRVDAGLRESNATSVVDEIKLLDQLLKTSNVSLKLAALLNHARLTEESRVRIQRILDEHPGTIDADLATLLPAWNLESSKACEVLDRYPHESLKSRVHLSIVGRAAAREGRADQAIPVLWHLLMMGGALPQDRLLLGRLCMARGGPKDAAFTVVALRDMGSATTGKPGEQPRPEVVLLRAEALAATGSVDGAKMLLQGFLKVHPETSKVIALLERLSATS